MSIAPGIIAIAILTTAAFTAAAADIEIHVVDEEVNIVPSDKQIQLLGSQEVSELLGDPSKVGQAAHKHAQEICASRGLEFSRFTPTDPIQFEADGANNISYRASALDLSQGLPVFADGTFSLVAYHQKAQIFGASFRLGLLAGVLFESLILAPAVIIYSAVANDFGPFVTFLPLISGIDTVAIGISFLIKNPPSKGPPAIYALPILAKEIWCY